MKLAYISQYFSPEYKGPVNSLLNELSKSIDVLNSSSMRKNIQYYNNGEQYTIRSETINEHLKVWRYTPSFNLKGVVFPKDLNGILDSIKPDIIQSEEYYQPASRISLNYARRNNIPLIINVRRNHIKGLFERGFFMVANPLSRRVVSECDRLICLTEAGRKLLLGFFPDIGEDKVLVIPNSIDPTVFDGSRGERFREKYGILDRPMVLCVSRIQPQKRIDLLVKIFHKVKRELSNAVLVVIGPWNDNEKKKIDDILKGLHLDDVVMTGGLDYNLVKDAYAASDVVVLTSEFEPFGYCLLEAMSASKPVVAFSVGGIPEIIEDGRTGYTIPFSDLDAFALKIIDVLRDRDLASSLGKNGRLRIDERFLLRENAQRMIRLYKELIEGR